MRCFLPISCQFLASFLPAFLKKQICFWTQASLLVTIRHLLRGASHLLRIYDNRDLMDFLRLRDGAGAKNAIRIHIRHVINTLGFNAGELWPITTRSYQMPSAFNRRRFRVFCYSATTVYCLRNTRNGDESAVKVRFCNYHIGYLLCFIHIWFALRQTKSRTNAPKSMVFTSADRIWLLPAAFAAILVFFAYHAWYHMARSAFSPLFQQSIRQILDKCYFTITNQIHKNRVVCMTSPGVNLQTSIAKAWNWTECQTMYKY